jgi:hypothetical protein
MAKVGEATQEVAMIKPKGEEGAAAHANAQADLRVVWDEMLADLGRARDAIDNPRLYPPPSTDRNLAEGYRYLLGFVHGSFERAFSEDPDFPHFRKSLQLLNKATIDNPDALYLAAPIDGNATYMVTGKVQDHRHWRGERPAPSGRVAPHYVIFEPTSWHTGDSGSITELNPGVLWKMGPVDSSKLVVESDGSFSILVAPKRPDGYTGNFLVTKATVPWKKPDGTTVQVEHTARYLDVRELFYDWEREEPLELKIVRVGFEGAQPPPLDSTKAAEQMRRLGELVKNQMRFWNEFYAVTLEIYEDMNGDGKQFVPRNDFNAPTANAPQFGAGQSHNINSGGIFELAKDEALILEMRFPIPPVYIGFQLANLWGESPDYANHIGSLNGLQAEFDADGTLRYVIAHHDPGVPNWVDTTGLPEGFMSARWTYPEMPDRMPTVKVTKVPFAKIRNHLPKEVRTVSPEERRQQIRIRQEHVQRRFRQY